MVDAKCKYVMRNVNELASLFRPTEPKLIMLSLLGMDQPSGPELLKDIGFPTIIKGISKSVKSKRGDELGMGPAEASCGLVQWGPFYIPGYLFDSDPTYTATSIVADWGNVIAVQG